MSEVKQPLLRLRDVCVSFGAVQALLDVNLELIPGEVLAIVGDNGAGKSTLVKVISGLLSPNTGVVEVDGKRQESWNPHRARSAGIETVYQDFALVEDLNVWRNYFLGNEIYRTAGPLRILKKREMKAICQANLFRIGLPGGLLADARAEVLSGGERQSLAIARAVHFGTRALVLDEPVAALAVRETERVFTSIRTAASSGLHVLYIDHNMTNVHAIADRIVFFRAGEISAIVSPETHTLVELLQLVQSPARHQPDVAVDQVPTRSEPQ
jgi:ABC-type sugar transport system ATPase subunit